MSKPGLIATLGILIALIPFLGFPQSWDVFLLVAFGLLVSGLAFWTGREIKLGAHCDVIQNGSSEDTYVQSPQTRNESAEKTF